MLGSITIQNFKAIQGEPLELNNLAKVNYLVGPNGCGKSSVLEGLFLKKAGNNGNEVTLKMFPDAKINIDPNEDINIKFLVHKNNIHKQKYQGIKEMGDKIQRTENTYNGNLDYNLVEYSNVEIKEIKYTDSNGDTTNEGSNIDKKQSDDIINVIKNVFEITQYEEIEIKDANKRKGETERNFKLKRKNDGEWDNIDFLAGGYIYLIKLSYILSAICEISNNKKTVLLIEEPEAQLHPKFQKYIPKLINFFFEKENANDNLQFIISTHSPFIINAAMELNNKNEDEEIINKVYHREKGICTNPDGFPETTSKNNGEQVLENSSNYSSVFDGVLGGLGVSPSDLLFANGIIWVEGPTDILYIRKWLELYQKEQKNLDSNFVEYKEGTNFSFQCLATAIWGYTTLEELEEKEYFENTDKIVNLLNLSRKNLFIIDKDTDIEIDENGKVQILESNYHKRGKNKKQLFDNLKADNFENGKKNQNKFWVNSGTVESYLEDFVKSKNGKSLKIGLRFPKYKNKIADKTEEIQVYRIVKGKKSEKAKKIFEEKDLKLTDFAPQSKSKTDLRNKISALYNTIQSWNQ